MKNSFGKLIINENWHNYVCLDGVLRVYKETSNKPLLPTNILRDDLQIAKSKKFYYGVTHDGKYTAFCTTKTEESSLSQFEEFIIEKEVYDYIESTTLISLIKDLGEFSEILFVGGGIKKIFIPETDSDDNAFQYDDIKFNTNILGSKCEIWFTTFETENAFYNTKNGGAMLCPGYEKKYEPSVSLRFEHSRNIDDAADYIEIMDKILCFLCKGTIGYDSVSIINNGNGFYYYSHRIRNRNYSFSQFDTSYVLNIKSAIKTIFELVAKDKVHMGIINLFDLEMIDLDSFQRLGIIIERYYDKNQRKKLLTNTKEQKVADLHKQLSASIKNEVEAFEKKNSYKIDEGHRSFILSAPEISVFKKLIIDLNEMGKKYNISLTADEIERCKKLRNTVHGEVIGIGHNDAKIFANLLKLLYIKILVDAGAKDSEIFNFTHWIKY